eukprot:scaffold36145_cov69-Phaeocystis_antarctica.AAC.8
MAVYAEVPNSTRIERAKQNETVPWNTDIGAHREKTRRRNSASSTEGKLSSRPPQRRACGSVGSSIAEEDRGGSAQRACRPRPSCPSRSRGRAQTPRSSAGARARWRWARSHE